MEHSGSGLEAELNATLCRIPSRQAPRPNAAADARAVSWLLEGEKEPVSDFTLKTGRKGAGLGLKFWSESGELTPSQKQTERCHPSETRPLNVREYARLQTFPDEWAFTGAVSSQYKQIGNAVPVNLGYHVGRSVIQMLEGKKSHKDCELKTELDNVAEKTADVTQMELIL